MPIRIREMMAALSEHKHIFNISFTGGELFLIPNIVDACREITKRHFVGFTTNLVTGRIRELNDAVNPHAISFIVASFHPEEFEKVYAVNMFVDNYLRFWHKGVKITAKAVAYPKFKDKLLKYQKTLSIKGVNLAFSPFIGELEGKKYPDSYSDEELRDFCLNPSIKQFTNNLGKPCNAGYNAASIGINGDITSCSNIPEKLGNIYTGFKFNSRMKTCPNAFCDCPLKDYDKELFEQAQIKSMLPQK